MPTSVKTAAPHFVVPMLLLSVVGCHRPISVANVPLPEPAYEALREALQPLPEQAIQVVADSAPSVFPGVHFFQATRVPPFGKGEDVRPDYATLIAGVADSVIITRVQDLPRAWKVLRRGEVPDTASAREVILTLVESTAVISSGQIVRSPDQLRSRYPLLNDSARIQRIEPPSASMDGPTIKVQFTADERIGIIKYEFTLGPGGYLDVQSTLLARYITSM